MSYNQRLGRLGENIACRYLKKNHYQILARNYRAAAGEIDVVARKDGVFHFIEVKARTNESFGWPEEAVNDEKFEKIAAVAEQYLAEIEIEADWQIDILSLIIDRKKRTAAVSHLKNISG